MKENLFKFYKNEVRYYALIYKRMKLLYYSNQILVASIMLNIFAFLITLLFIGQTHRPTKIASIIFFVLVVIFSIVRYYFNKNASRIVRKHLRIPVKKRKWDSEQYKEYQMKKFINYLIDNDLFTKWKIEKMIEQYSNEMRINQMPRLVAPGILIAVSAPNITQLVSYLYSIDFPESGGTWKFTLFVLIFVGTIGIIGLTSMFYWIKQDIEGEFLQPKVRITKNLILMLEDALLHIPSEDAKVQSRATSLA